MDPMAIANLGFSIAPYLQEAQQMASESNVDRWMRRGGKKKKNVGTDITKLLRNPEFMMSLLPMLMGEQQQGPSQMLNAGRWQPRGGSRAFDTTPVSLMGSLR